MRMQCISGSNDSCRGARTRGQNLPAPHLAPKLIRFEIETETTMATAIKLPDFPLKNVNMESNAPLSSINARVERVTGVYGMSPRLSLSLLSPPSTLTLPLARREPHAILQAYSHATRMIRAPPDRAGVYMGISEGGASDDVSTVAVDERGSQPAVVFHALPRAHDRSLRYILLL